MKSADSWPFSRNLTRFMDRLWPTPTLTLAFNAVHGGLKLATGKRILDPDACTLCDRCAEVCPAGAVSMQPGPAFSKACVGCWACFNACPENALRMGPRLARPATQYHGMSAGKADRVLAKLGY